MSTSISPDDALSQSTVEPAPAPRARDSLTARFRQALRGLRAWHIVGALALYFVGDRAVSFVQAIGMRFGASYPHHWIEENLNVEALWVATGHALYARPSAEHIALMYQPVYTWLSALFIWLFGHTYMPGRAIAIFGTFLCCATLGYLVGRFARSVLLGVIFGLLFVTTYRASNLWFDSVNLDTLFLGLLGLGATLVYESRRWLDGRCIGGAIALALCFFTKQPGAFVIGAIVLAEVILRPRFGLRLAGLMLGICGLAVVLLLWRSHGWYWRYVVTIPAMCDLLIGQLWRRLRDYYISVALLPFCLAVVFVAVSARAGGWRYRPLVFFGLLWLATMVAGVLGFCKVGGTVNSVLYVMWATQLLAGLCVGELARCTRAAGFDGVARMLCLGVVIYYVYGLPFDPASARPSPARRAQEDRIKRWIRETPGDVLVTCRPSYKIAAGKPWNFHYTGLKDLAPRNNAYPWPQDILDGLASRRWAQILDYRGDYLEKKIVGLYQPANQPDFGGDLSVGGALQVYVPVAAAGH